VKDVGTTSVRLDSCMDESQLQDGQLRMAFVCLDPDVPTDSKMTATLESLCHRSYLEIIHDLLTPEGSVAKRIVSANRLLNESGVKPEKPGPESLRS